MVYAAGDSDDAGEGFEVLFRREFGPITRTAYLIVGDVEVAREIAQDAFVQVLRHWEKVRELESPGGWVRRVAIRKAVRTRRRDSRGLSFLRGVTPSLVGEPDVAGLDVHRALLKLSGRQRAVIALYYLDDRPVTEIAALLGCGVGTVKTHLARGRRALAAYLEEEI
jgi:DNA-directed RNA polymerase specialized sigma24 family protein